jgi:flagellar hook-basal body complex protein FliE
MIINEIEGNRIYSPFQQAKSQNLSQPGAGKETMGSSFKDFLDDVNSMQKESGDLQEKLIKGEPVDIHDVMIATEKAKTGFQLLMEMRNKFLDLYKEATRMQV